MWCQRNLLKWKAKIWNSVNFRSLSEGHIKKMNKTGPSATDLNAHWPLPRWQCSPGHAHLLQPVSASHHITYSFLSGLSTQLGTSGRHWGRAYPISCHLTCREKHCKYKAQAILAGCKEEFSSLEVWVTSEWISKGIKSSTFQGNFKNSSSLSLLEWW